MPRLKRRTLHRASVATVEHIVALVSGSDVWGVLSTDGRQMWAAVRDDILARWATEFPGHRPWAWWAFDAPARRERVDGRPHPFEAPKRRKLVAKLVSDHPEIGEDAYTRLAFGLPAVAIGPDFHGDQPIYETEPAFLRRHKLLLPGEGKRLGRGPGRIADGRPVVSIELLQSWGYPQ